MTEQPGYRCLLFPLLHAEKRRLRNAVANRGLDSHFPTKLVMSGRRLLSDNGA